VREIHDGEPLRVERSDAAYRALLERHGRQTLVCEDPAAYLVVSREDSHRSIGEVGGPARGVEALLDHLFAHYDTQGIPTYGGTVGGSGASVTLPATHPLTDYFARICTAASVEPHQLLRLVDLGAALSGFAPQIERRLAAVDADPDRVVVGIEDGERVELAYDGGRVTVDPTDDAPDLEQSRRRLTRHLFGPHVRQRTDDVPLLDAVRPLEFFVWPTETV
jgi:hypothetical protein